MNAKESPAETTLNSLDGIRRAEPDAGLFRKIQAGIALQENKESLIQKFNYWPVAAGIALLIALNVVTAFHYHNAQKTSEKPAAVHAADYLSYLEPIKL